MDFPGGSVVKTSASNARDAGLIPGWRAKIPRALWPKKQQKTSSAVRNLIKTYKKNNHKEKGK